MSTAMMFVFVLSLLSGPSILLLYMLSSLRGRMGQWILQRRTLRGFTLAGLLSTAALGTAFAALMLTAVILNGSTREGMELFGIFSMAFGATITLGLWSALSDNHLIAKAHRIATWAKKSLPTGEDYDGVSQLMNTLVNEELPALLKDRKLIEQAAYLATENQQETLARLRDVNNRIDAIPAQICDLEAAALLAQTSQPSDVDGAINKIRDQLTSERALRLSAAAEANQIAGSQLATLPVDATADEEETSNVVALAERR